MSGRDYSAHARIITENMCTSCVAQSCTDSAHELWATHAAHPATSSLTKEQRLLNELYDRASAKARRVSAMLLPGSPQTFGANEEQETAEEARQRVEVRQAGRAQYEARELQMMERLQEMDERKKRKEAEDRRHARLKRAIERDDFEGVRSILRAADLHKGYE
jgi:hypothetical protein